MTNDPSEELGVLRHAENPLLPPSMTVGVDLYGDGTVIEVTVSGYEDPMDGITALAMAASEETLAALEEQIKEQA